MFRDFPAFNLKKAILLSGLAFSFFLIMAGLYLVFVPTLQAQAQMYLASERPGAVLEALRRDPYNESIWWKQERIMRTDRSQGKDIYYVLSIISQMNDVGLGEDCDDEP